MTEREAAQRLLARLPDSEMEIVAGFFAWRACLADIDEWGDLRALDGGGEVLRHLDETEIEEFGETLWDSWRRLEREGKIDRKPPPPPEPPPSAAERARERRAYAEFWVEYLPDFDIAVVIAFLAWRGRHSLRHGSRPAARMAAGGAEAMRRLGEIERRLLDVRFKKILGRGPEEPE